MAIVTLIVGGVLVYFGKLDPNWWAALATAVTLGYQTTTALEDRVRLSESVPDDPAQPKGNP